MLDKLKAVEARYNEIGEELMKPEVVSDNNTYKKLMQEHKHLTPIVDKYREYVAAEAAATEAKEMLDALPAKISQIRESRTFIGTDGINGVLQALIFLANDHISTSKRMI